MLLKEELIRNIKKMVQKYHENFELGIMHFEDEVDGFISISSMPHRNAEIMPTKWEDINGITLVKMKNELTKGNIFYMKGRMKIRPKWRKYKDITKSKKWHLLSQY